VLAVTGRASEGAFLYDAYVIHLLRRETSWCDAVHNAMLAFLLKERLSKAKPPLTGARCYHSMDLPLSAVMGGWLGFKTSESRRWKQVILESYWFTERWEGSLLGFILSPQYCSFASSPALRSH